MLFSSDAILDAINDAHQIVLVENCIYLSFANDRSEQISLKFVLKGPMYKISTLVQVMAWRRPGDKPSTEPMMVSLLKHVYVTRPKWY